MRWFARTLGILSAPLAFGGLGLAVLSGMSWSSLAYALALLVTALGLLTAPMRERQERWRGVTRAGIGGLVLVLCLRACTASRGETLTMTTTEGGGARLLARIIDEGDAATLGARVLAASGRLRDADLGEVPGALRAAYARMRVSEGDAPSPVLPTYAGLESPRSHGASTLARTVDMVRQRGFERIYLAGLSNGGVGVAHLAPRMRGTFRGVILISGAAPEQPSPGVPVLVVQGRRDRMAGAGAARAYAAKTRGEYVDLDAGHFALLLRETEAARAIGAWLRSH